MFERFTDRARRVMVLAQEETRLLNHNYIGTEHLLLGLAHEGQGGAAKALESLGIRLEALRSQVQEVVGRGQAAPRGHIPFTPRAEKVLELSLREALQLGHSYIGTEHLLLGLIREGEGVAAQVLVRLGADLSRVRLQVIQVLSGSGAAVGGPEAGAGARSVSDALREAEEQLAQVRRQKVAAVDAGDFEGQGAARCREGAVDHAGRVGAGGAHPGEPATPARGRAPVGAASPPRHRARERNHTDRLNQPPTPVARIGSSRLCSGACRPPANLPEPG
jgi:predicted metal-dependent hydrolase